MDTFKNNAYVKTTINKKSPRIVYQSSKADWPLIKEQTVFFCYTVSGFSTIQKHKSKLYSFY